LGTERNPSRRNRTKREPLIIILGSVGTEKKKGEAKVEKKKGREKREMSQTYGKTTL